MTPMFINQSKTHKRQLMSSINPYREIELNEDYVLCNMKLGQGSFGVVYMGYSRLTNKNVAIKQLNKEAQETIKKMPNFKQEIHILKRLKHSNIVQLYECVETQTHVYLIMEYCQKGVVSVDHKKPIPQKTVFEYFRQIVDAMAYMQNQGYMHRDIKPENILLDHENRIKIADFGLARQVEGTNPRDYSRKCTPIYAAPNIIMGQLFSSQCDVWSVGITVAEMLTGKHPFAGCSVKNISLIIIPSMFIIFYTQSQYELKERHQKFKEQSYSLEGNYHNFWKVVLPKMISYKEQNRPRFQTLKNQVQACAEKMLKDFNKKIPMIRILKAGKSDLISYLGQVSVDKREEQRMHDSLFEDVGLFLKFSSQKASFFKQIGQSCYSRQVYAGEKFHKLLIMFLCSNVYLCCLKNLQQFVKQDPKPLPDSKIPFEVFKASAETQKGAKQYFENCLATIQKETNTIFNFLQQIAQKLALQCKQQIASLNFKYNLVDLLQRAGSTDLKPIEHYLEIQAQLIKNEFRIYVKNESPVSILRILAMLVRILWMFRNKDFNSRYKEPGLIESIKNDIETMESTKLVEEINIFQGTS